MRVPLFFQFYTTLIRYFQIFFVLNATGIIAILKPAPS